MKRIISWFYAWLSQSFFSLIPVIAAVAGGILLTALFPHYGLLLTLLWVIAMGAIYVKYFRWF